MKIKVQSCFGSNSYWRLCIPVTRRVIVTERIPDADRFGNEIGMWTRKQSREALDLLERVYHVKRSSIRFEF